MKSDGDCLNLNGVPVDPIKREARRREGSLEGPGCGVHRQADGIAEPPARRRKTTSHQRGMRMGSKEELIQIGSTNIGFNTPN